MESTLEKCHHTPNGKQFHSRFWGDEGLVKKTICRKPLQIPSSTDLALFISPVLKFKGDRFPWQVGWKPSAERRGPLPGGVTRRPEKNQLSESLPLFPPPLPEAGRRRGLPGSAAGARAGSKGSARQLGPRRGALGRGSVNIHEAPPLLRSPPDPGARRSPLCPGLPRCTHAGAASAGPRFSPRR